MVMTRLDRLRNRGERALPGAAAVGGSPAFGGSGAPFFSGSLRWDAGTSQSFHVWGVRAQGPGAARRAPRQATDTTNSPWNPESGSGGPERVASGAGAPQREMHQGEVQTDLAWGTEAPAALAPAPVGFV